MVTILVIAGYLIGSIPTGLLVGLYGYGEDIRSKGSGNLGFTNTLRVLGTSAALLVLAGDVAKGFAAVSVSSIVFSGAPTVVSKPVTTSTTDALVVVLVAAATLIGNNFSIYLRFQGGKGIGVASGFILAFSPMIAAILFAIWVTVILVTRYVSLASITIAILFPILMHFLFSLPTYTIFSIAAASLAIARHKPNIVRMIAGTELRFGEQAESVEGEQP